MKRVWILLLIMFAAACGPAVKDVTEAESSTGEQAEVEQPTAENVADAADVVDDSAPEESEPTPTVQPVEPTIEPVEEEGEVVTAVSTPRDGTDTFTAASSPSEASLVRPFDWAKGAENPEVVIIEYGDFQ